MCRFHPEAFSSTTIYQSHKLIIACLAEYSLTHFHRASTNALLSDHFTRPSTADALLSTIHYSQEAVYVHLSTPVCPLPKSTLVYPVLSACSLDGESLKAFRLDKTLLATNQTKKPNGVSIRMKL